MKFFRPIFLKLSLILLSYQSFAQNNIYGEGTVNWNLRERYNIPLSAETYSNADLVILDDHTEFYFYANNNEKILRNVKYKINSQNGIEQLRHFRTPESFDNAYDCDLNKQGRRARIKVPFVIDYKVKIFAARKFSHDHWANVSVKEHYEPIRWIKPTGEFMNEDLLVLQLGALAIGDVLEIYYESSFNTQYGNNTFYFNSKYPKLKCEYDFIYRVGKSGTQANFILPCNMDSAHVYTSKVNYEESVLITKKFQFNNLKPNMYNQNNKQALVMPHVCADYKFYRSSVTYKDGLFTFQLYDKTKTFEWLISTDTTVLESKTIYDKQYNALKKFRNNLPVCGNDSQNVVFFEHFVTL